MRVFLSYRRRDNPYLAQMIRSVLASRIGAKNVFLDVADIDAGSDFRSAIEKAVARCDVVLVLIGPGWDAQRLHDAGDTVRAELTTVRRMGKRVLPVLHSEEEMPRVDDLPAELRWLAYVNAFAIGSGMSYEDDVARLAEAVLVSVVPLADLREQAWSLYGQSRHEELMHVVQEAWEEHGSQPSAALADCCRMAAVSSTRTGNDADRALWWARTWSTAHISGATNVVAASLVPYFFQLMAAGEGEMARQVLAECRRVLLDDAGELPSRSLLLRLYHEKMGYSLLQDGEYERALREYDDAAEQSEGDVRGKLKVDGARALCRYFLGSKEQGRQETEQVLAAAGQGGYRDVEEAAIANAEMMRQGGRDFVAYEVL